MPKVKKELPPPTVTHIMADGSVRTSLKGYLKSFEQLPETAQRLKSASRRLPSEMLSVTVPV